MNEESIEDVARQIMALYETQGAPSSEIFPPEAELSIWQKIEQAIAECNCSFANRAYSSSAKCYIP